jgi:hypothetical protein
MTFGNAMAWPLNPYARISEAESEVDTIPERQ